jgi:hypothetical protein
MDSEGGEPKDSAASRRVWLQAEAALRGVRANRIRAALIAMMWDSGGEPRDDRWSRAVWKRAYAAVGGEQMFRSPEKRRRNPLREVDAAKVGGLTNWRWRSANGVGWITVERDRDGADYHAVYQFFKPSNLTRDAGFTEGARKYHACLSRSDCKSAAERAGYAAASRAFNSGTAMGRSGSFGLRREQHFTSLAKARRWVVEQSKRDLS